MQLTWRPGTYSVESSNIKKMYFLQKVKEMRLEMRPDKAFLFKSLRFVCVVGSKQSPNNFRIHLTLNHTWFNE